MVQFAVGDKEEKDFWTIYQKLAEETLFDIEEYFKNAYRSPELGRILYEEQLMPIYKVLEKKLFIQAYSQVLEGEKQLGTIEGYLKILYAIFGSSANIRITTTPLHLQIDIIAPIRVYYLWRKKRENKYIIAKDGRKIVFQELLARVTDRDLLALLKATTNAGTFVEFTLNRTGE